VIKGREAFEKKGEYEEAVEFWRKLVLEYDSRNRRLQELLAEVLERRAVVRRQSISNLRYRNPKLISRGKAIVLPGVILPDSDS
jgi:hypothetical protein